MALNFHEVYNSYTFGDAMGKRKGDLVAQEIIFHHKIHIGNNNNHKFT